MARTDVTTRVITRAGSTPAPTAPIIDGDIIDWGTILRVITGATGTTVTIQTATYDGFALAAVQVVIPANQSRDISLVAPAFKQPTTASIGAGRVLVDYTSVVTVTREATRAAA